MNDSFHVPEQLEALDSTLQENRKPVKKRQGIIIENYITYDYEKFKLSIKEVKRGRRGDARGETFPPIVVSAVDFQSNQSLWRHLSRDKDQLNRNYFISLGTFTTNINYKPYPDNT